MAEAIAMVVAWYRGARMRRGWFLIASLLATPGCAATATASPVMAADGQPAISIECHRGESYCLTEAQRACPRGYWVLDARARAGDVVVPNAYGATIAPTFQGHMMIRCQ